MQIYIDDMVLFWLRAIVELRDNIASKEKILREESRKFKTFLEQMLCRVRDVANNMISHLMFFSGSKEISSNSVCERILGRCEERLGDKLAKAPTSSHVFLGLLYLLMSHVCVSNLCLTTS